MPKKPESNPNARWFTQGGLGWANMVEKFVEDGCPVSAEQLQTLRSIAGRLAAVCDRIAAQHAEDERGASGEDQVNVIATGGTTAADAAASPAASEEQPQQRRKGHKWPTRH